MRASWVAFFAAVMGAGLGAGLTWANFGHSPPLRPATVTASIGAQPKVLVDDRYFDFGTIESDTKARHAFRFTNTGKAMLTLKEGGTTCTQCTIAELEKSELAPGESANVTIEYTANRSKPTFRQVASILTNDPERQRVELTISGVTRVKFMLQPDMFILRDISSTETKTTWVDIFGYLDDEVRLDKYEFAGSDAAAHFELRCEPTPPEQLAENKARCGTRLVLTVKPGLPLGPVSELVKISFSFPPDAQAHVEDVHVEGTVDAEVTVVGRGWRSRDSVWTIGDVKSAQGATRKLLLVVRGEHRRHVEIKAAKVDPEWLMVTLGEPSEIMGAGGGGVTQIPLTVEIPPGAPASNHSGSDQGKYGELVLQTTHPQVPQIRMNLKFLVEQ